MKKVSFSNLFGEIYAKHSKELNSLKKEVFIKEIILIVFLIFICRFVWSSGSTPRISLFIILLIITIGILMASRISRKYARKFKQKAIKILVEAQNETYEYKPKIGLSPIDYKESGFDKDWDKFYSEDYISGKLGDMVEFEMSQIKTIEEHDVLNNRGETSRTSVITFCGLYGIIKLPVYSIGEIEIMPNSALSNLTEYSVNTESADFERYYDVLAEDRLWAMQIFNSETLEAFLELREFFKKALQLKIKGKKIYFRMNCCNLFEPPQFKNPVNFDLLYKYYRIIDIPRYLYVTLVENIARIAGNKEFYKSVRFANLSDEEIEEKTKEEAEELKKTWFSTKKDK